MVEEISGIAYVYKQDFFNNLYEELGIALENFVYYKDETHYFVMTTKKHSLLDRKVLKKVRKSLFMLLICDFSMPLLNHKIQIKNHYETTRFQKKITIVNY